MITTLTFKLISKMPFHKYSVFQSVVPRPTASVSTGNFFNYGNVDLTSYQELGIQERISETYYFNYPLDS